jgi:hypothetical protein
MGKAAQPTHQTGAKVLVSVYKGMGYQARFALNVIERLSRQRQRAGLNPF